MQRNRVISDEIRTPMHDIVGLYNIALRKPDLDDDTRDIISHIGKSVRTVISLINDMLEISLIESGNMKLKSEVFSFGNMLEQINTMTETKCKDKSLLFDCRIEGHIDERYIGDDLKLLREKNAPASEIPVIFLSGDDELKTEMEGLFLGAVDFIRKPMVPEILSLRVSRMRSI